jgi:hypothetical protein
VNQRPHSVFLQPAHWLFATPLLLFFLLAPPCSAQELGQVACVRPGDYVYLYSSMTTLDVRDTLQCGQEVEITGRYDSYFGVRTAKGEIGYVPLDSLVLLKTAPGTKVALPPTPQPAREKIFYDAPAAPNPSSAPGASRPAQSLILLDSTPIRMKLGKTLSSANAHVGDEVNFTVSEDIVVDGFLVIPKGAVAIGVVNEAEPKKVLGRGGKLSVLIRSVRLADNEQAGLRSSGEGKGSSSTAGVVIPVVHGKDVTFPEGMEFTAYVNGDTRLKREKFHPAPEPPADLAAPASNPPQHPQF